MQDAKNLKEYKRELEGALADDFLRQAMNNFAVAYRASRERAFAGMDVPALVEEIARLKDDSASRLDEILAEFKKNAEQKGIAVHEAADAAEANEIIARIAAERGVKKIVKSKSMTAEETLLNHHLEAQGLEVAETDLGEWIIQLRHEGPTHMVMPAIHLSRYQVADLFSAVTRQKQDSEIEKLVKVARRELRAKFAEADMGISGANFAIAETGTLGLVTNEGNARLVTTLPRVQVALVGLEKLTPTLKDALRVIKVLPRNATGQAITSYVTWITGLNECGSSETGRKDLHVVFLDNGRRALARDPLFSQVLRCVRCGACANVCPVYRLVGGHRYGHIYIGAIGLILTYFFHGRDKARNLVQNCLNCGACRAVCASGINLPELINEVHIRIRNEENRPLPGRLISTVIKNRALFHGLLRSAQAVQKPLTKGTPYLRHLPHILAGNQDFRVLPAITDKPFRDRWPELKPRVASPRYKAALFVGCAQDFVYPEQAAAGVRLLANMGVSLDFPIQQSCCGLPVKMMGEKQAAMDVARRNVTAFGSADYGYILTMCASCASYLKNVYPSLLARHGKTPEEVRSFSDKVVDFSSFVHDILGVKPEQFKASGRKAAYHSPCHLCRGLGVTEAPRELLKTAGIEYIPVEEEDVCCGFGGSFSVKFPELSAEILKKKLDYVEESGAEVLVTDCPGCVMQLRGGVEQRGSRLEVRHIAEELAGLDSGPKE